MVSQVLCGAADIPNPDARSAVSAACCTSPRKNVNRTEVFDASASM
jgi:hypothetical protein